MATTKQIRYSEPEGFFPKSIREKHFGKPATTKKAATKKATTKKK